MRQRLIAIFFGMLVILLTGVSAGQAQTVVDFTILGPRVVLDGDQNGEVTFTVYVAANDSGWQPILPGISETITLTAYEAGTQNPLTITGGVSFQSSATEIWNAVQVTLTGLNMGTEIAFQAAGYDAGPSGSNAPPTRVTGSSANDFNHFQVNVPHSANPNEPFPLIITPVRAEQNSPDSEPTGFTGEVALTVDEGAIAPTTVSLDLEAGESHQVMVTLDAVHPNNKVHVRFEVDTGPTPQYEVVFKNEDQAQLSNSSAFTIHAQVYQDDTPLTVDGVTTATEWNSTIWPLEERESHQFGEPWNMMTSIPGLGQNSGGLQFHDVFIPKNGPQGAVQQADLPGDQAYWTSQAIALGAGGWNIVSGTFPDGLAGDYWHRRFFLSRGQFTPVNATFDYHSAMFDQLLKLAEADGTKDNDTNTLTDSGVKGATFTTSIFQAKAPSESDRVFHMLASFTVAHGPVTVFLSFTPASRSGGPATPGIFIPDSLWNQNYQTLTSEFQNVSGDPLPTAFTTGTFWNRIQVLRNPGDGNQTYDGWSQSINTTGMHVITTTLRVHRALVQPGGLAEVAVQLDHPERDVAGVQFDLPVPQNTTFLGAVNFQAGPGFNISSNTVNDTTRILMTNFGGGKLNVKETDVLMKLIYQVGPGAAIGDFLALNLENSVISDPSSQAIDHNRESGGIAIGLIGDLAGSEGPDGEITVTDLVYLINIIIGVNSTPSPDDLAFSRADINRDMKINILDAQRMINIIIGVASAKQVAVATDPVRLEMGDVKTVQGQVMLPVQIQSGGPIAGIQLTLSYDPSLMRLGTVVPDARLDGMLIQQHTSAGALRILVISPDGGTFTSSTLSALLELPVMIYNDRGGEVTLSEVIVANTQAVELQTIVMRDRVKVATAPAAFALLGNQPNPFNPSTQIAYEVPEQSHITLTVFNLLGQEVIRLVDQVQSPGRYVVTWNARNARGLSVSSGIYMYRLTNGTGAVDTKRMTLLK